MNTFCLRHLNASEITLKHIKVKKINIRNARFSKVEKLQLPSDFRSKSATNLSGGSHLSNFRTEVCGDKDTDCTPCFHRQTGCSTLSNVENRLWMLIRQPFARGNQSMTRNVVSVLARYKSL